MAFPRVSVVIGHLRAVSDAAASVVEHREVAGVVVALARDVAVRLGVHVVEHRHRLGVGDRGDRGAELGGGATGLLGDLALERLGVDTDAWRAARARG